MNLDKMYGVIFDDYFEHQENSGDPVAYLWVIQKKERYIYIQFVSKYFPGMKKEVEICEYCFHDSFHAYYSTKKEAEQAIEEFVNLPASKEKKKKYNIIPIACSRLYGGEE